MTNQEDLLLLLLLLFACQDNLFGNHLSCDCDVENQPVSTAVDLDIIVCGLWISSFVDLDVILCGIGFHRLDHDTFNTDYFGLNTYSFGIPPASTLHSNRETSTIQRPKPTELEHHG